MAWISPGRATTGYVGYALLETPGKAFDGLDNDLDGIVDENRDQGTGIHIEGAPAIRTYVEANYDLVRFEAFYGPLDQRPAFLAGSPQAANYNLGFLLASGPFFLKAGQTERFSIALVYGANLTELGEAVNTVKRICDANYQFTPDTSTATLASLVDMDASLERVRLRWQLGQGAMARLEMLDLAGRRVLTRDVGSLGPGPHVVRLGDGARIRPGVYMLRLVQGTDIRRARAAVLE